MQPVFGLVEDHRLWTVHHRIGHLFVAMGGQAMHEQRVGLGLCHQRRVHLIGAQLVMAAFAGGLAVMHRHPSIGDDQIGPRHRAGGVADDLDGRAFGACLLEENPFGIKRLGAGKGEVKAKLPGCMGKACKDIIAIAAPDDLFAGDGPRCSS